MTQTRLVLIPSYNSGAKLGETVEAALRQWQPVWVVIDGSDDGSERPLDLGRPGLRVLRRARNGGKGAAVYHGLREAMASGFSHVLVMDADGQHPTAAIPEFMALSARSPHAMILGTPLFGADAPLLRVIGRKVSNTLARIETAGAIGDSLFGFRVYPLADLLAVMDATHWMRRFDFDVEAAVRLSWRGIEAVNVPVPVRYFTGSEGGISHFRYGRDNALLAAMHTRLLGACLIRRLRSFRR